MRLWGGRKEFNKEKKAVRRSTCKMSRKMKLITTIFVVTI